MTVMDNEPGSGCRPQTHAMARGVVIQDQATNPFIALLDSDEENVQMT